MKNTDKQRMVKTAKANNDAVELARIEFVDFAEECGSNEAAEVTAILSVGREFLPPEALAVLDGGSPTVEYYEWLLEQVQIAQAENDREVSNA